MKKKKVVLCTLWKRVDEWWEHRCVPPHIIEKSGPMIGTWG